MMLHRSMRANTSKLALNRAEDVTGELKAKHVNVQEHTIFVDGTELSERREMEIISDGPSEGQLILKHTRRIDGQEYTVMEKRDHGQFKSTETIT